MGYQISFLQSTCTLVTVMVIPRDLRPIDIGRHIQRHASDCTRLQSPDFLIPKPELTVLLLTSLTNTYLAYKIQLMILLYEAFPYLPLIKYKHHSKNYVITILSSVFSAGLT